MKKTQKNLYLLYMVFAALLVCANCIAAKQVSVGRWFGQDISITVGIVCYPITFLITDVIGEIWGKKEAQAAVIGGFFGQVIAVLLVVLANLIPADNESMDSMFNLVLGSNWILTVGSLTACILSQSWDVYIFHKIRTAYIKKHGSTVGGKWIWNNVSTMSSQLIDSVVFYIGLIIMLRVNGVILPINVCIVTVFVYWLIKVMIAALDTPFFYLLTRKASIR